MGDAVIVSATRTAIGTARKGTLLDVGASDLSKWAIGEALKRSGIPADDVDDIQMGEVLQGGGDLARLAAVELGLLNVPGVALQRHCASGMAAVQGAAASIKAGMDKVVIAGGAESVSSAPSSFKRVLGTDDSVPWMSPSHPETPDAPAFDMSITVGWNAAQKANVTREEMDFWAYESHRRAVEAIDEGRFEEEIFPIEVTRRDGETVVFKVDEHPRRTTTMEKLASLNPLHPEIEGFSITAGNSSGLNDGSARDGVRRLGVRGGEQPRAARHRPFVGVVGRAAGRDGSRADARDPEGARAHRPQRRRRRSLRDQRGVRVDVRCVHPDPRHPARDHERERQRLQPRPPDRGDRCPHDRHAGARAPPARRRHRRGEHVRRWRHGLGHRHRGPGGLA